MAKVLYVKESRVRGYVILGISDGGESSSFTVNKITYSAIGSPIRGSELPNEELPQLMTEDEQFRALRRALSILSFGDNSKRALDAKLRRAGFSQGAREYAVRECEGHGYINEERQLEAKILSLANGKLHGQYYLRARLARAGFDISSVDAVIRRLVDMGEVDFSANLERLAEEKGVSGEEELRALAYKYGYKR
ncbi:MAG: RecX family transcriptional regulator [Clostridia bacterium]|nr:RecX family transcriptional regulator [Clostridia bacterium]